MYDAWAKGVPTSRSAIATRIAEKIRDYVVQRTKSGTSSTGGAFASYKPSYARRKKSSHVDLFSRNKRGQPHMLNNVYVWRETEGVRRVDVRNIGTPSRKTLAAWHQLGTVNMPPRPWLGLDPVIEQEMDHMAEAILEQNFLKVYPSGHVRRVGHIRVAF